MLIAGFVITGSGGKQLPVRAVGPKLTDYEVTGVLADPVLRLYDSSGAVIAENNDCDSALASAFTTVGAFALDAGSKDAALLVTVPADASYTAVVTGADDTTGEALVEVYEIE